MKFERDGILNPRFALKFDLKLRLRSAKQSFALRRSGYFMKFERDGILNPRFSIEFILE